MCVQTQQYIAWYERSKHWVKTYAAFCILRDLFGTAEHWHWGAFSHGTPDVSPSVHGIVICTARPHQGLETYPLQEAMIGRANGAQLSCGKAHT